ncbi:hypothetical protein [Ferrimonas marina]|uniref:hypothetical protein n=1 Tax=Ferrimonas marina TaxID=299255 RepID=UPI0011612ABF|nr:hypothetical protein [Ferrimonas marina]
MPHTDQEKSKPISHDALKKLSEEQLLDMLFEGATEQEKRNRQAAHELGRRNRNRASRVQLIFMVLATFAAIASAVAALITANCR